MLLSFLLVLSCAVGVAVCDTHTFLEAKYSNSLVLSSNSYELYWSFDPSNQNLSIGVRVKTLGWVGLGVSERGGMENADIVTGRVVNGNAEVTVRMTAWQAGIILHCRRCCISLGRLQCMAICVVPN